jgi:hypothetical protein
MYLLFAKKEFSNSYLHLSTYGRDILHREMYVIFLFEKICHKLGILSTLLSLHFDELFLGRAGGIRFGMIV